MKATRLFILLREGIDPWDVEHRPYGWRMFYYAMADAIGIVNEVSSRSIEESGKKKFGRIQDGPPPIPRDLKDRFAN